MSVLHLKVFFNRGRIEIADVADEPVSLINVRENGEFINPRTMQHTSGVIHYRMNYPEFDFHSLRHTHATLLAENDVPPKWMGHSNLEVTMKFYLHLTDKMQEKGTDILKNIFEERRGVRRKNRAPFL